MSRGMLPAVPTLRLYGTVTSPYVRRVRVVAAELGLSIELVDTATDAGQAAMRAVNPVWKIPALQIDSRTILDSRAITEHLMRHHGPGPLRPHDPADIEDSNLRLVIDGVLDALINCFYLGKDGVTPASSSYVAKQQDRAAHAMHWLESQADRRWPAGSSGFGLAEIGLCTTVEWMRFRETYPVDRHPGLLRAAAQHADRASMVSTRPAAGPRGP